MPDRMLRTILVVAVCFSNGASALAGERPSHASASIHEPAASSRYTGAVRGHQRASSAKQDRARKLAADRDPYADPAAPYKANRLSLPPGQPILDTPGQTTVLTRQVLDDMKATSLRDALRSTAGVTVGR